MYFIFSNSQDRPKTKDEYLKDFNSALNGPLHSQLWVKEALKSYHEKMDTLKPFYCNNCHELWPSYVKVCTHCKKNPLLYSTVKHFFFIINIFCF